MKLIKLIMPSQGDMEIVKQDGGTITLKPTYFGGECAGPIIQFIEDEVAPRGTLPDEKNTAVLASYRIKIKKENELKLMKSE
jgi:hypothetical protein